ncbi:MAG TPA: hypothetical protein PLP17_02700, partial [Oligoflexia bacterium]|nr:hypothetical protein [Oligoflexia bacterium]
MQLTGYSLELVNPIERESVVQALRRSAGGSLLVLNTCQRLECFGFAKPRFDKVRVLAEWKNAEAFERLSRIAAGLESRVLGELEVLGQVREAYRQYRELDAANDALLDRIFQDVLTLARKARRESGIDQKVTSLSALASQALLSRINPGDPIAVVGSGSLAGSVARYLSERGKSPIRIAGRCPENAMRLALRVQGFGCG